VKTTEFHRSGNLSGREALDQNTQIVQAEISQVGIWRRYQIDNIGSERRTPPRGLVTDLIRFVDNIYKFLNSSSRQSNIHSFSEKITAERIPFL